MILHAVEAGDGPPLVLLHGLFGNAHNFRTAQRALAARFRVIALDLRNHGASPHADPMSYAALAGDVRETLAAVGALPAIVVGHSMGGKTAMRLALDAPGDVARLVVVDIAPVAYPPHFVAHLAAMQTIAAAPVLSRAEADAMLSAAEPDPRARAFLMQNLRPGAPPGWRIAVDAIATSLPAIATWDAPGIYDGPTLFIAGGASGYITPATHAAIAAQFPRARVETLPGIGHWVHADAPDAFLELVTSFAE